MFAISLTSIVITAGAAALEQTGTIEEIIVTAQRRAESLQTVPVSVSALQGDDLAARSIGSLIDVYSQVPGLQYTPSTHGGSNANYYIRGIGQVDFISTVEPGVGVYIDGVYVARTLGGALDLLDVERVEVLRGPQGTLFGRNTIGGAINVVTRAPNFETEGQTQVTVGERERINASLGVNLPLVDDVLAARFSFTTKNQDGYGESLFNGSEASDESTNVGRVSLLWNATSDLELQLSADMTRTREASKHAISLAVNPSSFITADQNAFAIANGLEPFDERWVPDDIYKNWAGFSPGNDIDVWGTSLTATWDLTSAVSLKSITAYRELDSKTGLDFDGSPSAISDQNVEDDQEQRSQEFILSGETAGEKLEWVGGLFYLHEDGVNDILLMLSFEENPFGFDTDTLNDYKNTSYAVYGQGTFHVTDKLGLTAGVRYSEDEKENTIRTHAVKFGIDLVPLTTLDDSWSKVTYRLGAQYAFTDALFGYASFATGFKVGGFNGRAFSLGEYASFDPEEVETIELGVKADLLENRWRLNVASFFSDYTDIQTTVNILDPITGTPLNVVENAAGAEIYGLEVESSALFGEGWRLDLGATWSSAEYTELDPGANVTFDDELPQLPDWTLSAGLQYSRELANMFSAGVNLTLRVDYSYKDDFFHNSQNSQFNFEPAYELLNLRAALGSASGSWELAAYARNLLDEEYFIFREDLLAFTMATGIPAPPREVGVELQYSW